MNNAALLCSGTVQVTPQEHFLKKLAKSVPLRIKLGMDPTSPDLHLGHAVVLRKMKQFQECGHEVIFLIGDFTARIGDPSGKSKTRPPLTQEEIAHNMKTYFEQVQKILDPQKVTIAYNSSWLSALSSADFLQLCAKVTVARVLERSDFAQRLEQNQSVGFHELLYPLLQAYDSVALKADVELGGTDQTFNLAMGRFLQEQFGQEPQVYITMPLLLGLDGHHKMSKSLKNSIGLTEKAEDVFGKLMSISDVLMWHYYEILLGKSIQEIRKLQQGVESGTHHPMDLKKEMSKAIVAEFWSPEEADRALRSFEALFQQHNYDQAEERVLSQAIANPLWIVDLLRALEMVNSSSEAKRLIEGGAVSIDEKPVTDFKAHIQWMPGMLIKVGKHRICKLVHKKGHSGSGCC